MLAGLAGERGSRLLAADSGRNRAKLAKRALRGATAAGHAAVVVADGTEPAWPSASFDRVLVDAPCTGLGALRRRPEARWRRGPESVSELSQIQRRLLASALDAVRPGGVVAYVTCSPHLAETRVVVDDTLRARTDTEVLDAPPILASVLDARPDLDPGPYLWFWPHRHRTDAMFCALLRRT
jgi:16S rRNA (cytosine967-C5)-methyltransferase